MTDETCLKVPLGFCISHNFWHTSIAPIQHRTGTSLQEELGCGGLTETLAIQSLYKSCSWNPSKNGCVSLVCHPSSSVLQNNFSTLLKPISEQIQVVQNFREKNRGSKLFNHLSAVSESIPALGWVAMVRTTWVLGVAGEARIAAATAPGSNMLYLL